MSGLRECPFCGGSYNYVADAGFNHWAVRCGVETCRGQGFRSKSREEAIKAWNTRSSDDLIKKLARALRGAVTDREARNAEGKYGYSLLTDELKHALQSAEQYLGGKNG